jgi:hypothetical protein
MEMKTLIGTKPFTYHYIEVCSICDTDIVSDVHRTRFNLSNLVQSHFIIYAKGGFRRDKVSKTDRVGWQQVGI